MAVGRCELECAGVIGSAIVSASAGVRGSTQVGVAVNRCQREWASVGGSVQVWSGVGVGGSEQEWSGVCRNEQEWSCVSGSSLPVIKIGRASCRERVSSPV